MRREKQKELFVELINKQLEPFGKKYEDVIDVPNWYMQYKTTYEKEKEFAIYAKQRIMKVLGLNAKMAENEVSWFILQWGLSCDETEYRGKDLNLFKQKEKAKTTK
jgi:hypothetical protein